MKIVAVTACPTGIAHTYMAATRLGNAARVLQHDIKIETQGAMGVENALSNKDITLADVVIIAADIPIRDEKRFAASRVVKTTTHEAIADPHGVLSRALALLATN